MSLSSTPTHPISRLRDHSLLHSDAFINGAWVAGAARFAVHDPATGEEIARVADLDVPQAQAAIAAAHAAWPSWRSLSPKQRSRILRRWFDLLLEHQNDLACILTAENGKPLQEAASEVAYAANFVEWYAEEAKRIQGEVIASFDPNRRTVVLRQPIGVCAAITPWNFPLAMVTTQSGAGAGRRLHRGAQASGTNAAVGAGRRRTGAARRIATGGAERHHRQRRARHGPRVVRKPGGAPPQLHRLHRCGPPADGAMRAHHQKAGARTRRQRPLYRF